MHFLSRHWIEDDGVRRFFFFRCTIIFGISLVCVYGWFATCYLQAVAGRRTVTMAAPLSHCGPMKYEASLHIEGGKKGLLVFCVGVKGCIQWIIWIEPDNMSLCCMWWGKPSMWRGVAGCCRDRPSMYWRECLQGRTGINPGSSKLKQLGRDEARISTLLSWRTG